MTHDDKSESAVRQVKGQYANYYKVGHNAFGFVIDFGQMYEDNDKPQFHTRIVTSPVSAKELLQLLSDSIDDYERHYRKISDEEP